MGDLRTTVCATLYIYIRQMGSDSDLKISNVRINTIRFDSIRYIGVARLLVPSCDDVPKFMETNSVWLQSDCNRYTKVRGGRSSSAPLHKTHKVSQGKSESEEYDTLGSDSDTEVGTSSRTESSNHLVDSHHSVSAADSRVHSMQIFHPSIFRLLSFLQISISVSVSLASSFVRSCSFSKKKGRGRVPRPPFGPWQGGKEEENKKI